MPRNAPIALALLLCLWAAPAAAAQPAAPVETAEALLVRAYFHLSAEGGQGPLAALADLDAYEAALADGSGPGRGLAPALLLRSSALRALGRYAEAVTAADRLLLLPGDAAAVARSEAFTERGLALAGLGRHRRALEDFGQALAEDRAYAPALMARADLHFALGQAELAEADYGRAIEAAPENALAWAGRAVTRDDQGRHAEAAADFTRAIALDPGSPSAWAGRGIARSQLGDMEGMCADYREACARGGCLRLGQAKDMGYCGGSGGGAGR